MAKFFRQFSDFWNTIMGALTRVISSYSDFGGEIFDKVKDTIALLLGKTAEIAESAEEEE